MSNWMDEAQKRLTTQATLQNQRSQDLHQQAKELLQPFLISLGAHQLLSDIEKLWKSEGKKCGEIKEWFDGKGNEKDVDAPLEMTHATAGVTLQKFGESGRFYYSNPDVYEADNVETWVIMINYSHSSSAGQQYEVLFQNYEFDRVRNHSSDKYRWKCALTSQNLGVATAKLQEELVKALKG